MLKSHVSVVLVVVSPIVDPLHIQSVEKLADFGAVAARILIEQDTG